MVPAAGSAMLHGRRLHAGRCSHHRQRQRGKYQQRQTHNHREFPKYLRWPCMRHPKYQYTGRKVVQIVWRGGRTVYLLP